MKKTLIAVVVVVFSFVQVSSLHAADKKLGKIFIKATSATVDGKEFPDQEKEDSVKDLKKKADKFVVVDSEADADYLLVVVERNRAGDKIEVRATLSVKENGEWKPATLLTGPANRVWSVAAERLMKEAAKWAESRAK